ncbi:hypothetical protein BH20GEM2_BH20GEM2_11330 [soil metagenome]
MALWGAIAGWALFSMHVPVPTLRIGLFLLVLALYVWIVFDAVRLARAAPANYWPRQYHRVLIYVALVAFLGFILQPAFTATIQATTAHAYRFPSGAMSPTILAGDYFYVSPHVPDQIQRGHLIAWRAAPGDERIHRIMGLPGDTVAMRGKELFVNGTPVREAYVQHIDPEANPSNPSMQWQRDYLVSDSSAEYEPSRDDWGPLVVPAGRYFVLGDNRDNSYDSRYVGFVRRSLITGQPIWIYLSLDPIGWDIRWNRIGKDIE